MPSGAVIGNVLMISRTLIAVEHTIGRQCQGGGGVVSQSFFFQGIAENASRPFKKNAMQKKAQIYPKNANFPFLHYTHTYKAKTRGGFRHMPCLFCRKNAVAIS